ncbi:MAG TPA: phytoene desaturase family protein [Anaerolineales bacterium]|nr:phytoene desaturase family protein [Anaerolineales bacterium]
MTKKKVVVIGAGLAGLAAAVRLAQNGYEVRVVEKNARPGGRCDRLSREGHTFDTGPTLFIMPQVYADEFARLGVRLDDALDLQAVDPSYRLVFDDGSGLALTPDLKAMQAQLEAVEAGSFAGYLRYLEEGHRHYAQAMPKLVNVDFRRVGDFFRLESVPLLWQLKPLANHYRHMQSFFKSPRLKAAFSFQDVYMGLSPFEAPATFSMMSYTEMAHGVYYPRGGMYAVVEALEGMAKRAGVELVYDCEVQKIEVNGQKAKGVVLEDGSFMAAEAVLGNADLPYIYQNLLAGDPQAGRLGQKRYSCSVITFFWGVDQPYPALGPHTLFLADDYRRNFEQIIDDLDLPDNPSLYIHAPTRLDASMAPTGEETLIAIVPVGHLSEGDDQDWKQRTQAARQAVMRRLALLGIRDLEAHIKFEICFTPLSWRKRYNLVKGSTHGLCHNLTQLAYFRPSNRHARYHNLYFAGASTRPGTGMPTALISGRLAAERMMEEI